jgi:magnesium chelatase family protein
MTAKVLTVSFVGIEVKEVEVQVQIVPGLPYIGIVGLPDKTVGESKERVKAAFHSMGLGFPQKRVTINLAPADLLKEGGHYDLAIALGIMVELKVLKQDDE